MKIIKLLLFFLIISCVIVVAQPPFVQEISTEGVLEIAFPKNEQFKLGNDITLHFHVFNSTGFIRRNDTAQCTFHLYNSTGKHIIEDMEVRFCPHNNIDFELNISSSIINKVGRYPYIIQCQDNDTQQGGFLSTSFNVVEKIELNHVSDQAWLPIMLALISCTLFFGFITYLIKNKELEKLKIFFFSVFVVNSFLIGMIPVFISLNPFDSHTFRNVAIGYLSVNGILLIYFVYMRGLWLITKIFKKDKKKEDE